VTCASRARLVIQGANAGQRILDFAESLQHGLFVGIEQLFGTRLLDLDAALVLAAVENGCKQIAADIPDLRVTVQQIRQVGTGQTERCGQVQRRPAQGLGNANSCRLRGQLLLGLAHVGTTLEQFGRQAGGYLGRHEG